MFNITNININADGGAHQRADLPTRPNDVWTKAGVLLTSMLVLLAIMAPQRSTIIVRPAPIPTPAHIQQPPRPQPIMPCSTRPDRDHPNLHAIRWRAVDGGAWPSDRTGIFKLMWDYEVISDADVPAMTNLGEPTETAPRSRGGCTELLFSTSFDIPDIRRYEHAVGATCRVVRTKDGVRQECGGAVNRVEPVVHVTLNGAGWQ
jgi:hypothetical protein